MMGKYRGLMAATLVAVSMSTGAWAEEMINLCTGGEQGTYFRVGNMMDNSADSRRLDITNVSTNGSWENMRLVSDLECHAAIVQADAYTLFARQNAAKAVNIDNVGDLHEEFAHMICNKDSDIDDAGDLESDQVTIAIGKTGSGPWVTWQNWMAEDSGFEATRVVPLGGIAAQAKVSQGADVQCMLEITGLGSSSIHNIDSRFGANMTLVTMDNWSLNNAEDPKGNKLYTFADIPSRTYGVNLQKGGWSSVETIKQSAVLVINTTYFYEHEGAYEALLEAYAITQAGL
jgi:hypothetical protein